MKKLIQRIRAAFAKKTPVGRACLRIDYMGQKTLNPKVIVSAYGKWPAFSGAMTVFVEPKNDVGEARARMYAKNLAEIVGIPVYDDTRTP